MAFWTLHSESGSSAKAITVDDLLGCHAAAISADKEEELPTVDQLLEADGLLHEMRLQNPLLLSYVTRRPIMQELLNRSFRRGPVADTADSNDLLSLDTLVHLMNGAADDAAAANEKKLDTESSICFEIVSSESSLVCKALLQDHFEQIMDVLRWPKLEPLATGRICRLLMNFLNYNEELLKELLHRHDFGTTIVAHIGNFSLMDCLSKSRIICLMNEELCGDLMQQIVREWGANPEMARSSADLLVCLCRRNVNVAATCLARLIEQEFSADYEQRLAVREALLHAVIALCDLVLPTPYVALEMHTIGKQILIDSSVTHVADMDEIHPLIRALNENNEKIGDQLRPRASDQPFGQLRYLLLCLFMRLMALTTAPDRFAVQKDFEQLCHWLKRAVLDHVVPNVLIEWPMNNHAHQAMLGVVEMTINAANLLDDKERESLAAKCIESWYELEQENRLCPGGWAHWYRLIRKLSPEAGPPPATKNNFAKNAFLWTEHRECKNRERYQRFAPPADVALGDQLNSWQDEDDEAAWLTSRDDVSLENSPISRAQEPDEFHSLWWCSPEDMSSFPDSPVKDDELESDCVPTGEKGQSPPT